MKLNEWQDTQQTKPVAVNDIKIDPIVSTEKEIDFDELESIKDDAKVSEQLNIDPEEEGHSNFYINEAVTPR